MQINGVELEIHFFDPDFKERKEAYLEVLSKIRDSAKEEKSDDQVRKECEQVKHLFDVTFGDGTGEKVCGKGNDHLTCLEAFDQLVTEQISQCDRYERVRKKLAVNDDV